MNKEIKGVLQLLALTLPIFALMIIGWLYSPMYADVKAGERQNAQLYLISTYFFPDSPHFDREDIIKHYGFTDEEINPMKVLRSYMNAQGVLNESKTHSNQNLGGLE